MNISVDRDRLGAFCRREKIDLLLLFGSRATGRFHSKSDVDIAVQFNPSRKKTPSLLDYQDQLESLLKRRLTPDVVLLSSETDPVLREEIFSKGKPLFESTSGLFQEEVYKAWLLFQDTAPLRRIRSQLIDQYIGRSSHGA